MSLESADTQRDPQDVTGPRKLSQTVDLVALGPITRIDITKNDKIQRRLSKVLSLIQDHRSVLLMAKGDGIQKLVTITEIIKQKLGQTNKQMAKLDGAADVTIGDRSVDLSGINVVQLNYLDYILEERPIKTSNIRVSYSPEDLAELRVNTMTKVPVVYAFLDLDADDGAIIRLTENGWTRQ